MIESSTTARSEPAIRREDRIVEALRHLGIEQAHFAANTREDWQGLATNFPEMIASLTLVCPEPINAGHLRGIASRLLVVSGDRHPGADLVQKAKAVLPDATFVSLCDYVGLSWEDIIAVRGDEIGSAMLGFLGRMPCRGGDRSSPPTGDAGEVAGLSYCVRGSGPPLVLLPFFLAPSQWEPLLPKLCERHCTVTLGGPELGIVPILEARCSAGYRSMLRNMLAEIQLQSGESVLEVGSGSGVILRWLAHLTGGANRIVGVDINRYLLREARSLARKEGLDAAIDLREGNAAELPFPDEAFDVCISSTLLEEVDADKALAEMIRVTKPGGRVGCIVRATDMPWLFNLPLSPALKAKCEHQPYRDEGVGCASASLYRRFHRSPLTQVRMTPYFTVIDEPYGELGRYVEGLKLNRLSPEEATEWHAAVAQAAAEGTYLIGWPHHCAVGTKPGERRLIQ